MLTADATTALVTVRRMLAAEPINDRECSDLLRQVSRECDRLSSEIDPGNPRPIDWGRKPQRETEASEAADPTDGSLLGHMPGTCPKCGATGAHPVRMKGPHKQQACRECGKHIAFIPKRGEA